MRDDLARQPAADPAERRAGDGLERVPAGWSRFGAATPGAPPVPAPPRNRPAPQAPRRRRSWPLVLALAVLAAALVAGGYAGGRILATPDTVSVLVTVRTVPAGQALGPDDLATVSVDRAERPDGALDADQRSTVTGRTARVDIPAGALLRDAELAGDTPALPGAGQALVGLALKAGQLPAEGLQVGDTVTVVATPAGQQAGTRPLTIVPAARVWAVGAASGGATSVTLLVDRQHAATVAGYGNEGSVSLVRVSRAGAASASPSAAP